MGMDNILKKNKIIQITTIINKLNAIHKAKNLKIKNQIIIGNKTDVNIVFIYKFRFSGGGETRTHKPFTASSFQDCVLIQPDHLQLLMHYGMSLSLFAR